MKRTKRSPEETQAAVERVKDLVKGGMGVGEALEKENVQASSWSKYKNKRKGYTKKQVVVKEVTPMEAQGIVDMTGGVRRWTVISTDPEVITRILEKLS